MTTEQLANMLAEINREAMSGQLECRSEINSKWERVGTFVSNIGLWRIKPKPREVWVNAEDMQVRNNNPAESMGWSEPWKWRKFREVIDD